MDFQKCSACLNTYKSIANIHDLDKNNIKWLTKLQSIIPELEWREEYVICEICAEQLETAWDFKNNVLSLEESRRIEIESKICSDIDDYIQNNCSIEYNYTEEKELSCNLCLKRFTATTQLYQHKLQFHNEQLPYKREEANDLVYSEESNQNKEENFFICYNCNQSFNTKDYLINHIENEHNGDKKDQVEDYFYDSYKDSLVSEDDLKEYQLSSHLNKKRSKYKVSSEENDSDINKELNSHFCKKCNISFSTNIELGSHNFLTHKSNECAVSPSKVKKRRGRKPLRKFNCEICNEEFDYSKLVIDHCITVHGMDTKIIKPYPCEKCKMRFVSSANLDQHRNYHNKNRSHICSQCGKGFITKSDLTVHEYTHYNRRNYKCILCDKAFNTNKNLRTHNLVVHTDRSLWKYACSICEKRFPLKTNYDQHFRRHTGEKEHACHICKKTFISKSELQRHVHMHSNIRAFKCSNCDKEYKERRTYQIHLAKKHGIGDVKITVREKKFVCHICPSQFYDKQKLTRHIYSHSGVKPFPCYVCDKKFTDKSYLKHHLKTVHSIEGELNNEMYNDFHNKSFD